MTAPILEQYGRISVVRDDLFPGGTKARFIPELYRSTDEVVYASPAEGGAQFALATVAAAIGKRATIFVAKRRDPHARSLEAKRLGAKVLQVSPGYLSVVQSRARRYCEATGATLAPFGMNLSLAVDAIAAAARQLEIEPDEVWAASGSGVLMRGLSAAWPDARRHAVQVGKQLCPADVAGAEIHIAPMAFGRRCRAPAPFPSDPHYDAKAWEICRRESGEGRVLFWNVAAAALA